MTAPHPATNAPRTHDTAETIMATHSPAHIAIQGASTAPSSFPLANEAVSQQQHSTFSDARADMQAQLKDQRRELVTARDQIKALEAAVAKLELAVTTPVPVPKLVPIQVRTRVSATGPTGGYFEIEVNGDRDHYKMTGVHVVLFRRSVVGGRVSKRHCVFNLAANKGDANRLEALLEMMDLLSWDPAAAIVGVVVAEVANQTTAVQYHHHNSNNLGMLLACLGIKQVVQVPAQKAFAFMAKLHGEDKSVIAECVTKDLSVPTEWLAMEL
ncbi:hypothetical protein AMAG_08939 [Allomyces macrogynus ATCC 38327]|uniref:Uncharacterized protein n=1 Tax=Allomyces macrogynus (strain ATCC 38327) TaxID=578462 RepID=A0A0L0SMU5_ALLM3|nr:hypothetical protein AMAG_08939 [Allomyces macrogynus ATCC 38327]|eukprot:KNE63876.1 hypothetical protein AMAG_08939 [Allomyces macrogynus ATCC 38327]